MSKINLEKKWVFDPLHTVVIENHLAKLLFQADEGQEVNMEGIINFSHSQDTFQTEDYIQSEYQDGILKIILQDIDSDEVKDAVFTVTIPEGVYLKVKTDNYPISLNNLKNKLKVLNENSPIYLQNCQGDMHLENENGLIRLSDCEGNIDAKLENGPLSASKISGQTLHLENENGPIKVRMASFTEVELYSENGPIFYETIPVENGNFQFKTENGSINLVLPNNFDFTLEATTQWGRVKTSFDLPITFNDNIYTMINGEGTSQIKAISDNGTIKINAENRLNLDFVMNKLEQIKIALQKVNSEAEKQKVVEMVNKITTYINRLADSIKEEKIKEKITSATSKLKDLVVNFDFRETNDKVIKSVEDIGSQIQDAFKEGIKNIKESVDDLKKHRFHTESVAAYVKKILDSPQIKPYLGGEHKKKEKENIADRSRIKILEMLEAGKITAEEAERLLKAIG
ncbi:MAG TPA: DUF4097 family beta strand repeat-containing protein, partial [Candidatus Cloacimonas acidaminovorans]|nr:DUF4097 family beta strand repeat-containing protein [Candidatus Cloacimonas acidaminovorans]HQI53658.1 DUF4097 family beta strand repeat-containing protein [Candidatus Cloacimonas acidaminovorans]HQJ17816.1 DUF4097 family beta strand repeat-containing protein [Candidatus Cloacimonas acidaminovorans]